MSKDGKVQHPSRPLAPALVTLNLQQRINIMNYENYVIMQMDTNCIQTYYLGISKSSLAFYLMPTF
jgi:hypothetical protein